MKNISLFILLMAIMVVAVNSTKAQPLLPNNQYLFNKYAMNTAFAGSGGCFEGYFSSRQNWSGFENAPRTQMLFLDAPLYNKSSLGGYLTNDKYGIFQNTHVMVSYGYYIKIGKLQKLYFGLAGGLLHKNIDYGSVNSNNHNGVMDPMLNNVGSNDTWNFDAAFGIVYQCREIKIGFAAPSIVDMQINNASNCYKFHASNLFTLSRSIQLEPTLVVDMPTKKSVVYCISAVATFKQQVKAGLIYRKNGDMGIMASFIINRFSIGYSYEFGPVGPLGNSGGSHDITIGVIIGKSSKINNNIPFFKPNNPYNQWVN